MRADSPASRRSMNHGLRCCDLQVALTNILKELWWSDNQVDQRPDKREEGTNCRACHEESVVNTAPGVSIGPINKCDPDNQKNDGKKVGDDVHGKLSIPSLGMSYLAC